MSTERSTTTVPAGGDPKGSPIRSVFAIVAGWFALFVLGQLFLGVIASTLPADIPSSEGAQPTERGLAIWLAGMLPNGILAGILTARIAGWAPIAHAAVLGGIVGFFGMVSSDEARGMPAWFAIGRALMPLVSIVFGGVVARALEARRAERG